MRYILLILFLCVEVFAQRPSTDATLNTSHALYTDLKGAWLFNEGSGTTITDYYSENDGTIQNSFSWSNDTLTVNPNGEDDGYVSLNADTTYFYADSAFTVFALITLNQFSTSYPNIANFVSDQNDKFTTAFSTNNSYDQVFIGDSDDNRRWNPANDSTLTQNRSIVLTYNGNGYNTDANYTLYMDGVEIAPSPTAWSASSGWSVNATPSTFGGDDEFPGSRNSDMSLHAIYVWRDRELNSTEVSDLHDDPYQMFQEPGGATTNPSRVIIVQ